MLEAAIKLRLDFRDKNVYCKKISTTINKTEEVEKYKAKRHKGWRVHRAKVREIMGQEITPAEQETLLIK